MSKSGTDKSENKLRDNRSSLMDEFGSQTFSSSPPTHMSVMDRLQQRMNNNECRMDVKDSPCASATPANVWNSYKWIFIVLGIVAFCILAYLLWNRQAPAMADTLYPPDNAAYGTSSSRRLAGNPNTPNIPKQSTFNNQNMQLNQHNQPNPYSQPSQQRNVDLDMQLKRLFEENREHKEQFRHHERLIMENRGAMEKLDRSVNLLVQWVEREELRKKEPQATSTTSTGSGSSSSAVK